MNIKDATHIDLPLTHAALVFDEAGGHAIYLPPLPGGDDAISHAAFQAMLCVIFLQDDVMVSTITERAVKIAKGEG